MRKKRAVWILGVGACLIIGFAITTSWISKNSPDGRVEGTVAQIIEEYDFVLRIDDGISYEYGDGTFDSTYESDAISHYDIEQIDKRIRAACSGCSVIGPRSLMMGLTGGLALYFYEAGEEHRNLVSIDLIGGTTWPDWPGTDLNEKKMAFIVIRKRNPMGIWERVTSWFPW